MSMTLETGGAQVPLDGKSFAAHFNGQMKPMIILPPDTMSKEDMEMLRANGLCVVVAKNPALVKFVDPMPAASCRTQIEDAAIKLSRCLVNGTWTGSTALYRADFCKFFLEFLVKGTPLDPQPQEERDERIFDAAKQDELRRIAREEAKAERAAKKAADAKAKAKAAT